MSDIKKSPGLSFEDKFGIALCALLILMLPITCIQQNMGWKKVSVKLKGVLITVKETSCDTGPILIDSFVYDTSEPCIKYDIKSESGELTTLVFKNNGDNPFKDKPEGNLVEANVIYVKKLTGEHTIKK